LNGAFLHGSLGPVPLIFDTHSFDRLDENGYATLGITYFPLGIGLGPITGNPADSLNFLESTSVYDEPDYTAWFPMNYEDTKTKSQTDDSYFKETFDLLYQMAMKHNLNLNLYPKANNLDSFAYEFVTKYAPFYVKLSNKELNTEADLFLPQSSSYLYFGDDVKELYGVTTSLNKNAVGITQWDFPVAWAPNEYFAYEAMKNSKKYKMSEKIADGWRDTIDMYFAIHGIIIEKYSAYNPLGDVRVTTGYAKNNAGFGWTNGMYMLFVNERKNNKESL